MGDADYTEGGPSDEAYEAEEYSALLNKSVKEILEEGQKALFARLVARCRAGVASHQELAILRNVLKDNGLVLFGIPVGAEDRADERAAPSDLPDFDPPDYHTVQ